MERMVGKVMQRSIIGRIKYFIYRGKRRSFKAIVLLLCPFLAACTKDIETSSSGPKPEDGTALVILSIQTPQTSLPASVFTRSQVQSEMNISSVAVMVFEKMEGEYIFKYHVPGTGVASNGSLTQFKALLRTAEVPVKLMIVANPGDSFASSVPGPGLQESEIRSALSHDFTSAGIEGYLPMYGEVELSSGISVSETYSLSVTALRAVARVDVVKDLVAGSPEFVLEEVYVFRAMDRIRLLPDEVNDPSSPKVTAPSVPSDARRLASPVLKTVTGGADAIERLYIPESAEAVTNSEKVYEAATIVVGGRFEGEGSPLTYYRADFNSGIAGHPFGQVLRNHRYIFKIKNVSQAGWETPEEAADSFTSSMVVDVQAWEDFASEIYFGNDRFAISSRSISLRYIRDRERHLDVESTLDYKIRWLSDGVPSGSEAADPGTVISSDNFDAWIERDPSDGVTVSRIVFRTRNNNHLGEIVTEKLRISAGLWSVDITVSQDNSAMYQNRFMNVLSVTEVGDLGQDLVDSGASGLAMRKVLDAQFAPAGVIRIGGSSFTRIPNTTGYVGTATAANLAVMERIIGAQDVIYFPNNIGISSDVADILLAWLDSSPRRVLIIGTDSATSNARLLAKDRILADGTWQFTNVSTISPSSSFLRAPSAPGTEEFFDGPFGVVAEGAVFHRADDTAGYNVDPPTNVTRLIMASSPQYSDHMFFGVNRAARIVYHGDAQLFQTPQMSSNNGGVSSDLDRLMANLWAWIVEQVIYGDD